MTVFGGNHIADAQARCQRLGERAAIDGAGLLDIAAFAGNVEKRQDRRDRIAIIAKILIGGIFDHWDIQFVGMCQQLFATRTIDRLASRIAEISRKISELDLSASLLRSLPHRIAACDCP